MVEGRGGVGAGEPDSDASEVVEEVGDLLRVVEAALHTQSAREVAPRRQRIAAFEVNEAAVLVDLGQNDSEVVAVEFGPVQLGGLVEQLQSAAMISTLAEQGGEVDVDVGDVASIPAVAQGEAGAFVEPSGAVEIAAGVGDVASVLFDLGDVPPGRSVEVEVEVASLLVEPVGEVEVGAAPGDTGEVAQDIALAGAVVELGVESERGLVLRHARSPGRAVEECIAAVERSLRRAPTVVGGAQRWPGGESGVDAISSGST